MRVRHGFDRRARGVGSSDDHDRQHRRHGPGRPRPHQAVFPALERRRPVRRRQGRKPRPADPRRPAGAARLRRRCSRVRGLSAPDRARGATRCGAGEARCRGHGGLAGGGGGGPARGARERDAAVAGRRDRRRLRSARRGRSRRPGGGPVLGDRGGHRVGVVCGNERDVPERSGQGRRDRRGRAVLAVAVRRAHDLLPRAARLQPERHGHRGRGPAPDCLDARRRDVHDRSRHGRARPPGDRGVVRARRIGGLRAGVARPLRGREVDHVDPRALGPAQGADDRGGGRRRHRHPRPRREGEPPPGAERRGGAAAGGARDGDRARVRLAAGHRMGLFPRGADLDAPEPADHDDRRARGDRGGGGPIRNRGGDGTRSGAGRGTGPRRRRGPAAHVAGRGRKARPPATCS